MFYMITITTTAMFVDFGVEHVGQESCPKRGSKRVLCSSEIPIQIYIMF